jgi:phenylacetate-CoA ligase
MWAGGVTDHMSLEATGATVIPFGVGNTKQLIETIQRLKPSSISCTPSYMSRLEVVLKEEFDLQPPDLGLKKGFFGGEGGLQDQNVRNRIENIWNIKAIDANYGMAEVLSILGSECSYHTGLHFHGQGLVHLEIIDPNTGQMLPVKKGTTGELVLTTLTREGQPLIRYRTKDIITILDTEPCKCGRGSLRFRVEERKDDMIIVRGVNVYPTAIKSLLSEYTDFFSGEFKIILSSPPPIERPLLQVELTKNSRPDEKMLRDFLIKKCHEKLNFTPVVNFIPWGKFPRTEGKSEYVCRNY